VSEDFRRDSPTLLSYSATLLACAQAILSERHREWRDRALTEANVAAAGCAVLAPLLLGSLADHVGLHAAFAVELVLIGASGLLLLLRRRTAEA
jgi:MFS family permease